MGVGGHDCGLGCVKEAERATDDHFQSWAHARTGKTRKKHGSVWGFNDGQGISARAHKTSLQGYDAQIEKGRKNKGTKQRHVHFATIMPVFWLSPLHRFRPDCRYHPQFMCIVQSYVYISHLCVCRVVVHHILYFWLHVT